jgi:hypothetical protein
MEATDRESRLECARLAFGIDGQLAFAEYYALLPDPSKFSWTAAVEHIADRLALSEADLTRLLDAAEPIQAELDREAEDVCRRHGKRYG